MTRKICFSPAFGHAGCRATAGRARRPARAGKAPPAITPGQIEADWLRQDAVRGGARAPAGNVTPEQDAGGGCDGSSRARGASTPPRKRTPGGKSTWAKRRQSIAS